MCFLPMSRQEMHARGWDRCDVILVTGDAYVDHPSFGAAVVGRTLEAAGYRVGIIAQPDWRTAEAFAALGRPRLFFGVTSGNIDSMLHHYTANRKLRHDDPYSPGGRHGLRPNRAAIVYANRLRQAYREVPIVIGGIEASLRRLAHYDYWDDAVRRSILFDAKADVLAFGMGERQIVEIALRLEAGVPGLADIPGTATILRGQEAEKLRGPGFITLPSYEEVSSSPEAFNRAFMAAHDQASPHTGKPLLQRHGDRYLLANPPALPLTSEELDAIYELPFTRKPHPSYQEPVPALETVKWSIVSHRGCYGGCSFCSLYYHQGPEIQSRSIGSIVREARLLASSPGFKGTITDIGGPTANMYGTGCRDNRRRTSCRRRSCLAPTPCGRLDTDHGPNLRLWQAVLKVPGVKRVLVASGVRYDLAMQDRRYLKELVQSHTGGHLKVAPEHCSAGVLRLMNKPDSGLFAEFLELFRGLSRREQYLVPYLISSHPGCTLKDMQNLKSFLAKHRLAVEQVQDFIPLPMTASAAMYHTGMDPFTGEKIFVERSAAGKLKQRHLLDRGSREEWEGAGTGEWKKKA